MTADALRLILDDDLTIEIPIRSAHVACEYTRDVYVVHVRAEDLLEVLAPEMDPRGAPEATETLEGPHELRGDPEAHQQDPDDIPDDLARTLFTGGETFMTEHQEEPTLAWWVTDAREVAEATIPKAVEYGSTELIEAGRTLARLMGRPDVSDQEAMETMIWSYMAGKMGRWTAALNRGERVSDDTVLDIQVYATMVRRIRQAGVWP